MSDTLLKMKVDGKNGTNSVNLSVKDAIIAGWTGRDREAMEKHIRELEELGVKRPRTTPIFYRVSARRLTIESAIEVSGGDSSGEVEFILVVADGELFVGVGSDHTDRKVETYGITVSKQMCDKPIASDMWRYAEVAAHWDQLKLRSYATIAGERVLYQEGGVASMLQPEKLIALYLGRSDAKAVELPAGSMMFCGTLAARGGIRSADRFEFELEDPVLGRRITHRYDVRQLPIND